MSTSSFIGIENETGVEASYCHWDGYLEHNGIKLFMHYNSRGRASLLINQGSLSSLGDTIAECDFYANRHEDIERYAFPSRDEFLDKAFKTSEKVYLFTREDKWIYWSRKVNQPVDLEIALSRIKL